MEVCRIKIDVDIMENIIYKCFYRKPYINYHIPIKNVYLDKYQVILSLESISANKVNYPYISLYCDKTNDIHLYIDSLNHDINDVCISNVTLKSEYFVFEYENDGKIIFHN